MAARLMLRMHLEEAWRRTIAQEYAGQLINSEKGLQVFFCKHLLDCFKSDKVSRRLFIEPRVSMPGSDDPKYARHPDIVICHTRKIIGIVEIKYLPRTRAKFKKDLLTLDWLLEGQVDVALSNDRYRGPRAVHKGYSLAGDAVYCWAGVHCEPETKVALPDARAINDRVFVLHAITSREAVPIVRVAGNTGLSE